MIRGSKTVLYRVTCTEAQREGIMDEQTAIAWTQAIYSSDWTKIFISQARARYAGMTDHEALAEDARQRLAMSLTALGQREPTRMLRRGYIFVAFKRALVDVFRELVGRQQPRKWLKDLGQLGERLFDLYCLMRLRIDEILAALREDAELQGIIAVSKADVRAILAEMDRRRECEGRPREILSLDADPDMPNLTRAISLPSADPAEVVDRGQASVLRLVLVGGSLRSLAAPLRERLTQALTMPNGDPLLDDEEFFILRCLRDGITEQRVGEMLGGLSVRQVRYKRKKTIDALRAALHAAGLSAEDFQ